MAKLVNSCFCGVFKLEQGSMLISIYFMIVSSLLSFIYSVGEQERVTRDHGDMYGQEIMWGTPFLILSIIGIIVSLICMYGLYREKYILMIPMMVWLLIVICFMIIYVICCFFYLFDDSQYALAVGIPMVIFLRFRCLPKSVIMWAQNFAIRYLSSMSCKFIHVFLFNYLPYILFMVLPRFIFVFLLKILLKFLPCYIRTLLVSFIQFLW